MTCASKQGKKMNSRLPACVGKTVSRKVFPKAREKKAREWRSEKVVSRCGWIAFI